MRCNVRKVSMPASCFKGSSKTDVRSPAVFAAPLTAPRGHERPGSRNITPKSIQDLNWDRVKRNRTCFPVLCDVILHGYGFLNEIHIMLCQAQTFRGSPQAGMDPENNN